MKNGLLSILAGLAMSAVGAFQHTELVVGLCLLIVGLTFSRPISNRRQAFAMVCIGVSGPLMLMDYSWSILLPNIAGLILISSTFGRKNTDIFSFIKVFIGLSWSYTITIPSMYFVAAGLMILMGLVQMFIEIMKNIEEVASSLDPT
ncbi:MAG: hypothetical protein Q8O32_02715 [bacterium]|nr:hypothetical protein [bacterium]